MSASSQGHQVVGYEVESLKASFQVLMQTTTEQLQMMKDTLKEQHLADLQVQRQRQDHDEKNEEKLEELQEALKAQKVSLDASKGEQMELSNKIKDEQNQLIKIVQDQGQLLQSTLKDSEARQKTYASVVKGQCNEMVNKLSSKIEELPKGEQIISNKGSGNSSMQFTGIFDAFVDRERRKNNVVVHNLTESDGDTHAERMTQDRSRLGELLRRELSLNVHIVKSFRVGKFMQGKSRLLIATLDSEESKWELVRIAPQLRGTSTGGNIYINPDLTKQEREEGKRLRSELAERRANGERNLVIRRGKIVKLQQVTDESREQQQAPTAPEGSAVSHGTEESQQQGEAGGSSGGPTQLAVREQGPPAPTLPAAPAAAAAHSANSMGPDKVEENKHHQQSITGKQPETKKD